MKFSFKAFGASVSAASFVLSSQAFASGYEKAIMWGGRSSGVAGIAAPYVQGSEALYFNPAGLVSDRVGHDVSFNISPMWSQFKGPINNNNDVVESEKKMLTPFGLIYGNTVNEKIGWAIGGYVSGGSNATYENVAFAGINGNSEVKTDLVVSEIAAGVGYRVTEDLKLGLAWRAVMADANFAFVQRSGANIANITVNDLEDKNFTGFKLGAQYKAAEKTHLSFTYRSEVKLEAEGKFGGNIYTPGLTLAIDESDAKAKTTFPMAAALGVQHDFNESWRMLAEYVWTQYSKVDKIVVEGTITRSGGTFVNQDPELKQEWKDQHQLRLGGEYLALAMPIRFGYSFTSQVTNDDYARASFTPPGPAHTITLGTGKDLGESFKVNGGLEYTWVTGDGKGAEAGTSGTGTDIRAGEYEVTSYAVHLGVSYLF